MASAADRPTASEKLICNVTGVAQPLRQSWTPKHRLRRRPRGMYEESDARELAALKAVLACLGPADGSIAWSLIQRALPDRWDDRPLILLFDPQDKQATLASESSEVAAALHDARPVIAMSLDDPIARASRAFRLAAG